MSTRLFHDRFRGKKRTLRDALIYDGSRALVGTTDFTEFTKQAIVTTGVPLLGEKVPGTRMQLLLVGKIGRFHNEILLHRTVIRAQRKEAAKSPDGKWFTM